MNNKENKIILFQDKEGKASVSMYSNSEDMWLTRDQIADIYATTPQNISQHIRNIYADGELFEGSTRKTIMTSRHEGMRCVNSNIKQYNLDMIIALGFRVRNFRGTQFRQWATGHLSEYLIKGFTIDSERLKNPNGRPDYFDELLARIRDIRASEKRFYQKFRELFALSSDYYPNNESAQICFEALQDKLFYAVTKQTAAEIISSRANAHNSNMGLTTWQGSRVRYCDVVIARNYLREDETDTFNRLVSIFIDHAELRVKNRQDLTMNFWKHNVDRILKILDMDTLHGIGSITVQESEQIAKEQYELFDAQRKKLEASQADAQDLKLLEEIEKKKTSRITART